MTKIKCVCCKRLIANTAGGHWIVPKAKLEENGKSIGMWVCLPCQIKAAVELEKGVEK